MIGSLWLPQEVRNELKSRIGDLRKRHEAWGEIKWSKVAPNRRDFYVELVDLFFAYGENLRFRCIAVDRTQIDLSLHDDDAELGFTSFTTSFFITGFLILMIIESSVTRRAIAIRSAYLSLPSVCREQT
ncbi:hypothetical protein NDY24_08910 [Xanthomonas hortorum pv. pelargonii]|nr:hypothetical protein NDY24_08910 [Xanthomonas hortorum pv. pelargonii]